MKKIGMIGIGVMGHGIAQNILSHGYSMVLYDVRPEAMTDLILQGAEAATSPQALGTQVDTVIMIVNSYPQCYDAMSKLLETMHSGTVINMSTISIDNAITLSKMAEKKGVSMLDCPVSGGSSGAKNGTLTVMAAGADTLLEKYRPVFECFCKTISHVGTKTGQGQAVKAINQLLVGIHMCATAEAFTLAKKCNLNLQTMFDTIKTGSATSRIFENRGQSLIDRDFSTRSTLQIQLKDMDIACKTADAVGSPSPLANVTRELFKLAVRKYPPTDDSSEVIRIYEELCGLEMD